MYKYGGIYSDLDIYYLNGIESIINNQQYFIYEKTNPCISFFGSNANNAYILEFAKYMIERYMEISKTPNLNDYYTKWKLKYILIYLKWFNKKWLNTPELKDNIHDVAMLCNEEINDEYFIATVNKCVTHSLNTDYKILIFWATGWQKIDYTKKPKNQNNKYQIVGYY